MSYIDAKTVNRSPAAIAVTAGAHVAIGWLALTLAGVTPSPIDIQPIGIIPIKEQPKSPPPPDIPDPKFEPVDPKLAPPTIDIKVPLTPETPRVFIPEGPDLPHLGPVIPGPGPVVIDPPKVDPVLTGGRLNDRYARDFQPPYPTSAKRAGHEGVVSVAVQVGTDGRATSASIAQSSGHEALDRAALKQALKRWRFVPATRDGVPVETTLTISVRFEIENA